MLRIAARHAALLRCEHTRPSLALAKHVKIYDVEEPRQLNTEALSLCMQLAHSRIGTLSGMQGAAVDPDLWTPGI